MMAKLRWLPTFFNNRKLKHKIILTYIVLSILPIGLLNVFVNLHTQDLLLAHETAFLYDALQKATLQADQHFETYNTLSDYIFSDSILLTAVNDTYGEGYFQMYLAYAYSIEPRFLTYYALHADLNRLTLYTASDLYPSSTHVAPLENLEAEPWFDSVRNSHHATWIVTETQGEKHMVSVRRLMKTPKYPLLNYVYMDVDYDSFFASFRDITADDYGLLVLGPQEEVFYAYGLAAQEEDPREVIAWAREGSRQRDEYVWLETSYGLGRVLFFQPASSIVQSVQSILGATFIALWLVLALIGVLAYLFSKVLVKPIEDLTANMLAVRGGDLSVTVSTTRTDEVGIMIQSFSEMIQQLKELIEVAYANEIEKKEYQLKLLYAQINPHFLYNALSLINSRALLSGHDEISQMALLIASFYRTSLNQGKDMITVENELQNITSYLEIQRFLTDDAFSVAFELDPSLNKVMIPHFILQPVVENAIDHGLLHSESPEKWLRLRLFREGNTLVFHVEDNGAGMTPEDTAALLTRDSKGYGVKNVNHRLALIYGGAYRFEVESEWGRGTRVIIVLPVA